MNLLLLLSIFIFPILTFAAATSKGCIEISSNYYEYSSNYQFYANATFSIDQKSKFVMASNITLNFSNPNNLAQRICIISDNHLDWVCVSDLTYPIGVPIKNSTFLLKAFYFNETETALEFNFGPGVFDEESFSFTSGELFSEIQPCVKLENQGDSGYSLEQCCTAFKSVPESNISAPMCSKFKSRTTIYNIDDNYSIYATTQLNFTLNHTDYGKKLLVHGFEDDNQEKWDLQFNLNNYDFCQFDEVDIPICTFEVPNVDGKLLFRMKIINETHPDANLNLHIGRLIFRNNQTLMEEGIPFTKNNNCGYYSQLYSPNQVSATRESISFDENLTLDEIYHTTFQFYTKLFVDILFPISTIFYIFGIYVIFKKSTKAMGFFKYTILIQLTCNMIVEFCIFFMNPVLLFPLSMTAFFELYPIIPMEWLYFFAMGFVVPFMGTIFAYLLALGFRVYAVFNLNFFITSKQIFCIFTFYGAFTIFASFTIAAPFAFTYNNPKESQEIFKYNIPVVAEINNFSPINLYIFLNDSNNHYYSLLFYAIMFWFCVLLISTISLNSLFYYQMKKIKKIVSKDTYALQKMLHKSLVLQLLNAFILIIIPMNFIIINYIFHIPRGNWLANLALPIGSLHIVADITSLLYFVKPYRNYVKSLFNPKAKIRIALINSYLSRN